jgi:LuxR family maltose regulon positive regulatory protein
MVTLERCRAALGRLDDRISISGASLLEARVELSAGNPSAAATTLERLRHRSRDWQMPWFMERWCELVELEISLARAPDQRRAGLLRRLEDSWGAARPEGHRIVLIARAHLIDNRPEEALRLLAAVTGDSSADLVPATEAWVLTSLAHDRLRQDDRAIAALEEALTLAEPQDIVRPFMSAGGRMQALLERQRDVATPHRAFVELLLSRLTGDHAPVDPGLLIEGLTRRERSVLQLIPTMMSNAEIADALSVSVNTVKVHLKSLYRKLGVSSRRQAVSRARALGLLDSAVHG